MKNPIGETLLDQYRVDDFIAAGGMGAVYRVFDLNRSVFLAMKVLHTDLAEDPSYARRFQREADALRKLAHPNILPFYGIFQTSEFAFLLTAFVDGPTLSDVLSRRKRQPLSILDALAFLKALSAALGYAHHNGVIHSDIKPGNIMLDQGGNIYLTDFGIARHTLSATTTSIGSAGTPAYMAPEQIRGEKLSPAADIYALGILTYELLTGQRPFRGDEVETEQVGASTTERIVYAHLHLPPPDPRSLNPHIPEPLAQAVLSALEKEPGDRYASTQAFFTACLAALSLSPASIPDRVIPSQLAPEAWEQTLTAIPVTPETPSPFPDTLPQEAPANAALAASSTLAAHPIDSDFAAVQPQQPAAPMQGRSRFQPAWIVVSLMGIIAIIAIAIVVLRWLQQPPASSTLPAIAVQTSSPEADSTADIELSQLEGTATFELISPDVTSTTEVDRESPISPESDSSVISSTNPEDGAEVVFIPQGEFTMGANPDSLYFYGAEAPEHDVYLDEFWIYRHEVTNSMYRRCIEEQSCPRPRSNASETVPDYFENPRYADYPVVQVGWSSADAYCKWAGARLPTEAEWEKAARGVDGRMFPWGDQPANAELVNFCDRECPSDTRDPTEDDGFRDTSPVGNFPAGSSPFGVYDMAGNVLEWVQDYFQSTYYRVSPAENPRGPASGDRRVIRGGSWYNLDEALRSAARASLRPDAAFNTVGFRCAVDSGELPSPDSEEALSQPQGKLVFTCQVSNLYGQNEICMANADGSEFRQLTDNGSDNLFPSFSPDGGSIVYASKLTGVYEIYELNLKTGRNQQLTDGLGKLNAPDISPDGARIVFTNKTGGDTIWVMNRDGGQPREIYGLPQGYGWDPVWSPDGSHILFATGSAGSPHLAIMDASGANARVLLDLPGLSGRSDWSQDDLIATYAKSDPNQDWNKEIFVLSADGGNLLQVTQGGNSQAPSFSPDGQWIVFTAYFDNMFDERGCEIYIMRVDGSDLRRITENNYCDWQPRWGP